ncbi:MAG: hypothetical protein ACKOEZ_04215 [Spartobacteria bacterium]
MHERPQNAGVKNLPRFEKGRVEAMIKTHTRLEIGCLRRAGQLLDLFETDTSWLLEKDVLAMLLGLQRDWCQ